MRIKKAGGKVFGAVLTAAEKKAMHAERISVRYIAVRESEVSDWEDHIMNKPFWATNGSDS